MAGAVVPVRLKCSPLETGCKAFESGLHSHGSAAIGAAVFVVLILVGGLALTAIIRAALAPRAAAHWTPPTRTAAVVRPCAVYEIDVVGGRKYVGYGFNPHQRIMQSHRRAAWFKLTVTAQYTFEPDRVDWYESDETAHAEEIRRIRSAPPKSLVNKILYREGAA